MRQKVDFRFFILAMIMAVFLLILLNPFSLGEGLALNGWSSFLPIIFKAPTATPTPTRTPSPTPSPTAVIPTPVGPVGGTFTSLAVDPNQNDNLYAGHFQSGVYKSFNQGLNWYRKNVGLGNLQIQSLAAHPSLTHIVYAGTYKGGIYKSNNAGESWFAINGGVLGNHIVYDIEIDVNNPNTIYVATRVDGSLTGYIYKSTNAGASWGLILSGNSFDKPDYFYDIDVDAVNSDHLYLTTHEHGFYKSINAGQSFYPINTGVEDMSARSFALDPSLQGLVYAGVWHGYGVYKTWNGGGSWLRTSSGLPSAVKIFRIYLDPFGRMQKRVFACTYGNGLYSSDDYAQSWSPRGLAGQRVYDFLVTDGNPQRWYAATENNGLFRSNTYGSSWNGILGDLSLNAITALVRDERSGELFGAVYGQGVYRLEHGGLEWIEQSSDLPDLAVVDLMMDGDRMLVLTASALYELVGSVWEQRALPAMDSSFEQFDLDILAEKVGQSPEMIGFRRTEGTEIDRNGGPSFSVIPYRLETIEDQEYLLTLDNGLYMRVDEGWKPVGFEGKQAVAITREISSGQLIVSVCESESNCAVYASQDGLWKRIDTGLERKKVNAFLSLENATLAATDGGIYSLDDERQTWQARFFAPSPVLSFDQLGDSCNLAAGGVGSFYLSQDCGLNWRMVPLPEPWHYQTISYSGEIGEVLILGSREAGASVVPVP